MWQSSTTSITSFTPLSHPCISYTGLNSSLWMTMLQLTMLASSLYYYERQEWLKWTGLYLLRPESHRKSSYRGQFSLKILFGANGVSQSCKWGSHQVETTLYYVFKTFFLFAFSSLIIHISQSFSDHKWKTNELTYFIKTRTRDLPAKEVDQGIATSLEVGRCSCKKSP